MPLKRPSEIAPVPLARKLLAWYDVHRRRLPWRAEAGETADPYRVWLSEVMLQQTTVATVRPRFEAWVVRWPDVDTLAAADEADVMAAWAGLGYYARARNLVRAARAVVDEHGGRFPDTEAALRALPGLGDYTAAAVAAIAFGRRAVVVDANVERVVARLAAIDVPLPRGRPAIRAEADAVFPSARAGDFAQALMDVGSAVCTPRAPRCLLCPLRDDCAGYRSGAPERFPVKAAKAERPLRFGTLFWLERTCPASASTSSERSGEKGGAGGTSSHVFLVRRPGKGLLGGMRALPTGPWADAPPALADAPAAADWQLLPDTVEHGFTHFRLQLALAVARDGGHAAQTAGMQGEWWPVDDLAAAGLPTVFARGVRAFMEER